MARIDPAADIIESSPPTRRESAGRSADRFDFAVLSCALPRHRGITAPRALRRARYDHEDLRVPEALTR